MRRICLYFGSFNPIHLGHIALARYARDVLGFEEVRLVLSPLNPHKDLRSQLPYALRASIIGSALEGEQGITLEPIERWLPSPHYTLRSVQALSLLHPPETELALLMGADNLEQLLRWYRWQELLYLAKLYVYPRPGYSLSLEHLPKELHGRIVLCRDAPTSTLSATEIRQKALSGESLIGLMPRAEQWQGVLYDTLQTN